MSQNLPQICRWSIQTMKISLLFSVALVSCTFGDAAEPLYDGKPESHWINTLTNKNAEEALARLGDKQVRVLVKAMKQDEPHAVIIRTNAEALLLKQENVFVLSSLAESDPDPEVQTSAIGVFVGWLEHSNACIRSLAAMFLKELPEGWGAAYARLGQALKNPDPLIREAAAEALKAGAREQIENVLDIFGAESFYALLKENGRNWDITVKVVDEAGTPIAGAEVWLPWRDKHDWESINPTGASAKWAEFGRTAPDGLCKFSQVAYVAGVSIHARKSGYIGEAIYCSPPYTEEFGGPPAGKRVLPTVTLVLKKTDI
jgi:hypothetical protein